MCPATFGPRGDLQGCYRELPISSWRDAEDACEDFDANGVRAHLIVIDRAEEHDFISATSAHGDLWIGRLQVDDDDEFRNINYVAYGPTFFGEGEPNDRGCSGVLCDDNDRAGDERCIEYKHETGMWNDEKCGRLDRAFCEWDDVEPYSWRPGSDG